MVRQLCLIGITLREHGQSRPSTASVPSWRPAPPRPSTNGPKWRPPPPRPSTAAEALGGRRRPTATRLRRPTKAPDLPVGTDGVGTDGGFGFFDQQPRSKPEQQGGTTSALYDERGRLKRHDLPAACPPASSSDDSTAPPTQPVLITGVPASSLSACVGTFRDGNGEPLVSDEGGWRPSRRRVPADRRAAVLTAPGLQRTLALYDKVILLMHAHGCEHAAEFAPTLDRLASLLPNLLFGSIDVTTQRWQWPRTVVLPSPHNVGMSAPMLVACFPREQAGRRILVSDVSATDAYASRTCEPYPGGPLRTHPQVAVPMHATARCPSARVTCMHTCTHARMYTCTHARMHTCTHAHMHTCAPVGVQEYQGDPDLEAVLEWAQFVDGLALGGGAAHAHVIASHREALHMHAHMRADSDEDGASASTRRATPAAAAAAAPAAAWDQAYHHRPPPARPAPAPPLTSQPPSHRRPPGVPSRQRLPKSSGEAWLYVPK